MLGLDTLSATVMKRSFQDSAISGLRGCRLQKARQRIARDSGARGDSMQREKLAAHAHCLQKPIYLFADSQMLFWKQGPEPFICRIRNELRPHSPKAAYIGASSGDDPAFFELFVAAMQQIGITDCRLINSCVSDDDRGYVGHADLILLSGGHFERGWKIFNAVHLREMIVERHLHGAVLIGLSAGAVQLGEGAYVSPNSNYFLETFQLVPFTVGVQDDKAGWHDLIRAVKERSIYGKGIGVPAGGGLIYHADRSIEPVRSALHEFLFINGKVTTKLLAVDANA